MKRPDGITLISIYQWFVAGTIFLAVLVLLAVAVIVPVATFATGDPNARIGGGITVVTLGVVGIVLVAFGVANLVIGLGLWNFRPWARIAAVVLAVLRLLNFPLGTLVGGLTIWYLLKPDVERLFEE